MLKLYLHFSTEFQHGQGRRAYFLHCQLLMVFQNAYFSENFHKLSIMIKGHLSQTT